MMAPRRLHLWAIAIGLALTGLAGRRAEAAPEQRAADKALLDAVAKGDHASVKALLARGADVNARDDGGATALMRAALYADADLMKTLLAGGADVNAKNRAGANALMWGVGDLAKVKLLLERGADVNAQAGSGLTPLLIAANAEATAETVKLLLDRGADVNRATGSGFTPLMAAVAGGDPEVITLLLDQRPDVKAATRVGWTALHGAASNRDVSALKRLLDLGADANPRKNFQGRTPLMWAALAGDRATVQLLLDRGAEVNAKEELNGLTALLMAAGGEGGHADVVGTLLAKGADPTATDAEGNTALAWALRQGATPVARLLEKRGAGGPARKAVPQDLPGVGDANTVAQAVGRSLPLLQRSGPSFLRTAGGGCVSCHHQALPALAVGLARARGFPVDGRAERAQAQETLRVLAPRRELLLQGAGVPDRLDPAYLLAGLAAADQPPDRTTDALVHYLTLKQAKDGRWRAIQQRPPLEGSDFTSTALGVRALRCYGPQGRADEITRRIGRARAWLATATPRTTEDRAFQLLGLGWAQARRGDARKAAGGLLAGQREDGGWAQLPTLGSDAYATGQALVALHQAGGIAATEPAYRRGSRFLLRTQLRDGSWFVQTRSLPVQPYFESGFPHGKSQFIACAATAWATMALTLTVVPPARGR